MSMAGHMMQWKRVIPFPMTWSSAGHQSRYPSAGKPVPDR